MKNRVSVFKIEGPFTEWLATNGILVNPIERNHHFCEWYNDHDRDELPPMVLLPFGEDDYITNDLECLIDRLTSNLDGDASDEQEAIKCAIKAAELTNDVVKVTIGGETITITPYSSDKQLPRTPPPRFFIYREFADMARDAIKVMCWRFRGTNKTIRDLEYIAQDFIEQFGEDTEIVVDGGEIYALTYEGYRLPLWKGDWRKGDWRKASENL